MRNYLLYIWLSARSARAALRRAFLYITQPCDQHNVVLKDGMLPTTATMITNQARGPQIGCPRVDVHAEPARRAAHDERRDLADVFGQHPIELLLLTMDVTIWRRTKAFTATTSFPSITARDAERRLGKLSK